MPRHRRLRLLVSFVLATTCLAAGPQLKEYDSTYYRIHTNLPEIEAREARVRMTRTVDAYLARTGAPPGQLKAKLPFYLYKDAAEYAAAGGVKGSAGYYDGEKLMALTLRRDDGPIALSTWHVVQHEGFHQFAHATIAGQLPMWADEGLAEYFGQSLFTGDGFVSGLVPQARLVRVRKAIEGNTYRPLKELFALTREQWNAKIDMANYDQAWSVVQFLLHGDARLAQGLGNFLTAIDRGAAPAKVFAAYLGEAGEIEARWRTYWLELAEYPTADLYANATLAILTSYLARAHAQGQAFDDFDALVKTPPAQMKCADEDWLPPTLFQMAVNESIKMRAGGDTFMLVRAADGPPQIVMVLEDGTRAVGRFTLTKNGRVERVAADVVHRPAKEKTAARRAERPDGELLK